MPRTRNPRSQNEVREANRQHMRRQRNLNATQSPTTSILASTQSQIATRAQTQIRKRRINTKAQSDPKPEQSQATPKSSITHESFTRYWWHQLAGQVHNTISYTNTWSHSCTYCGAQLLQSENNGWCCTNGKFKLDPLPPFSPELLSVFEQERNISLFSRKLNNLLCFSVLGVTGGFCQLPAPSNVAITGRVYHQMIDATQGQHSIRWFLYDENARTNQAQQQNLSPVLVNSFREFLESYNPFLHHFRQAFNPNTDNSLAIELYTPTSGGEVAAIIHANNIRQIYPRSIMVFKNLQQRPQPISILSPLYEPLQYPLFFPHGTLGWGMDSEFSQIRWYRARLTTEDRFLQLGRLSGEYLVDMYSRVEEERLNYI